MREARSTYRAFGLLENGAWFWIGTHAGYDRFLATLELLYNVPDVLMEMTQIIFNKESQRHWIAVSHPARGV